MAAESHSILRHINKKTKSPSIISESLKTKLDQVTDDGTMLDENNIL